MDAALQQVNSKFMNSYQLTKEDRGVFAKMKLPPSHFCGQNMWILKATGFNRGIGIHVFNKLDDLQRLIKEYTEGTCAEGNVSQPPALKVKDIKG